MRFLFRDFSEADARAIAAWRYEPPYDVYDMVEDPEDLASMLNPAGWPDVWFAAEDAETGELAGFAELHHRGDLVEIGLGLRPDLTGRGIGPSFTDDVMRFARDRWQPDRFALDVLPWNERAIRAYEKAGFIRDAIYVRRFEDTGAEREFLRMERRA